jgi:HNH endonuclease
VASRPALDKAQWQRIRKALRQRDGDACRNGGATGDCARLSVHHLLPTRLGGTDDMANLATLCSGCHAIYEKAARTLTLPIDTPDAQERSRASTASEPRGAATIGTLHRSAAPTGSRGRGSGSTTNSGPALGAIWTAFQASGILVRKSAWFRWWGAGDQEVCGWEETPHEKDQTCGRDGVRCVRIHRCGRAVGVRRRGRWAWQQSRLPRPPAATTAGRRVSPPLVASIPGASRRRRGAPTFRDSRRRWMSVV